MKPTSFLRVILCIMMLGLILSFASAQLAHQESKIKGTGTSAFPYFGYSLAVSSDGTTAIVGGPSDAGGAGAAWVYTLSGGVWTQQGSKLVGTGAVGAAGQGRSVSLSSDGNTAIVGGPSDSSSAGAVWVFTRSGGVWGQQGNKIKVIGTVGAAQFGTSVSLSSDGNTAIVGSPYDNSGAGTAWVFARSGSTWTPGFRLFGTGAVGSAYQGWSVSLSSDGNTAIVGGEGDNNGAGAAWVFTGSFGIWTQQGNKLVGTGAVGRAYQGWSASLSSDGNMAIVGGEGDNSYAGAAWVFTRSSSTWTQQGSKLVGTGAVGNAWQGYSVSLSSDGNTAIVGGYRDNSGAGAAWVFARSGSTWTQQGSKLVGSGAVGNAWQGCSVSLSADGNTAIVGGYYDNSQAGAAWVYTRSGEVWTQQGSKLVGTDAEGTAGQGASVSLSSDGNTAIVGGPSDNSSAGATWVFARSGSTWTQQGSKLVGTGAAGNAWQGYSVSLSSDGNTAIVGGYYDNSQAGAAWVYARLGGVWMQQGNKLVGTGAVGNAHQGCSVSLSSDGNTAIVGGSYDNSQAGAAWVYTRSGGVWTQQGGKLVGTDGSGQGRSVSLSSDGNTAIVGGGGTAWVFTRSGSTWIQQGSKLVGTGAVGDAAQGSSVSLSSDGNRAIIGGPSDNGGIGAAWSFTRSGGVWIQQGNKMVGTGAVGSAHQGTSVSICGEGHMALVGGSWDNGNVGAFWEYWLIDGIWIQMGTKIVGTDAVGKAKQGCAVSLSSDGTTAIVGGSEDSNLEGGVWTYRITELRAKISSIQDVPADQGGKVRLRWQKSGIDSTGSSPQVVSYGVWRRIPSGFATLGKTTRLEKVLDDTLGVKYDFIMSVPAVRSPSYNVVAPTLADSTGASVPRCSFLVTAHTSDPNVYFISRTDSGYSVDNLLPSTPGGGTLSLVAANTVKVSWRPDQTDPDVGYYAVYRSSTTGFTPSPSTLLGSTQDTLYLDTGAGNGSSCYYRVTTVDIHGNQSVPTSEMSLSFTQSMSAGWNMIGVPGTVSDGYYRTLYPTATVGTLFGFTGAYTATDTLHPGAGYWLRFPSATSASTLSIPVQSSTLTLASGWNMIAGPSCTMLASAINDPGGIIVTGTLYAFNRGYVNSTTLERGKGYWMRARSAGAVTLTCGSSPKQVEGNPSLADVSNAPTLTIADASGGQQTLYWNLKLQDPSIKESYSMPPLPEGGCFDARFAGDYRLTESSEALATIQSDHYPVRITGTNVPVGSDTRYILVEMDGNKEGATHALISGATIEIQNANVKSVMVKKEGSMPLEFSLEQNYPNPFNPSTVIKYALPKNSHVTLTVFTSLGQQVVVLRSGEEEAGSHEVQFDARLSGGQAGGLASGVYLYRLTAGSYTSTRKLMVLR